MGIEWSLERKVRNKNKDGDDGIRRLLEYIDKKIENGKINMNDKMSSELFIRIIRNDYLSNEIFDRLFPYIKEEYWMNNCNSNCDGNTRAIFYYLVKGNKLSKHIS